MTRTSDGPYRAARVAEHIYWVGAVDWAIRDFHGYATGRGTTYNAYLVMSDKIALVDTVKAPFTEEMLARVASVVDPAKVDYLISNHAEPDHSGGLPRAIAATRPEKVFASTMGVKALDRYYGMGASVTPVKDGETLGLGGLNLTFVEARMLHWPDSMATYAAEDRTLLSNDAFGMHLASSERFADEIDASVLEWEAGKYYANILLPLSPLVARLLEKVQGLGIAIDVIAPSHGPIWRKEPGTVVGWYSDWAKGEVTDKAVVIYDTMWGSTEKMARAICEGLAEGGGAVKLMPLRSAHRSDVATELLNAGALLAGSPTLNNSLFPTVADVLTYVSGLKPRGLMGAAFGSYGWSGEAVGQLEEMLSAAKVELAAEGMKAIYVPDREALAHCAAVGRALAEKLKQRTGGG